MTYDELIAKALDGMTVNRAAVVWGIPQSNLDRYSKSQSMPNAAAALAISRAAGVPAEEVLEIIARQEAKKKQKSGYNAQLADVAQLVEQLIRNQ